MFIIPPTHVEIQDKVHAYNLTSEYTRYKKDLTSITTVYDFDVNNELNRNKDYYLDPYHGGDVIKLGVVSRVWK